MNVVCAIRNISSQTENALNVSKIANSAILVMNANFAIMGIF